MSPNVTRRRLIQGVGALGVAGVAGNALVSADDGSRAVQEDQAALRVAHASPDTPNVDVTLESADDTAGAADGGDEAGTATEAGDETSTATEAGGDGPLVEGLAFSDVSGYNELDPGTYQLQITATENTGLLEGIFSDEEERVVYDEEIELEGGTTYTAVAYGELAEADLGDSSTETDTPGIGEETETDDGLGDETDEADTPTDSDETETDSGVIGEETETDDGVIGDETETDAGGTGGDQVVVESLEYGDSETFELESGDYTLEFREASADGGAVGEETETDDGLGAETDTETDAGGIGDETETETDSGVIGGETETDAGATGSEQESRAFDVALLEDDVSAPGDDTGDGVGAETPAETETDDGVIGQGNETGTESPVGQETETDSGSDMTRIRVFHAVLDVDALEVTAVESDGDGGGGLFGGGGGNETETDTETGGAVGGETETETGGAIGGETETDDGAVGGETETPMGGETDGETTVQEAGISPEGGSVYSGFAVGYFYPEMADQATPTDDAAGEETDDGGAETPAETDADDGGVGQETETSTSTAAGDEIAEDDAAEEFQFVTVEDASDGERADGGTDDGGILPGQSAPPAASD